MWSVALALGCGLLAYGIFALLTRRASPSGVERGRSGGFRLGPPRWLKRRMPTAAAEGIMKSPDRFHYDHYRMSLTETLVSGLLAGAVLAGVGYLFYKSAVLCLLLALGGAYYPKLRRAKLVHNRRAELRRQFKHALYALSSALSAGRSVENAFRESVEDLRLLYPEGSADILMELDRINRRTENGEPIERSLLDFGRRSGVDDIVQFAEAFAACKRTGGDLVEVMRRTTNVIGEKLEVEQDIMVLVAQKRFEANALGFVPFVIVGFLAFSSPDYVQPLYEGYGRLIMTAALLVLGASQWIARAIMKIGA